MPRRQTVLIIDDSPDVHRLVEVRLRDLGVAFLHADSGEAGIAMAREAQPDIVLLDFDMPGINGFETCRRLKAEPATHDIPVVFLTGSCSGDSVVEAFDLGAVDHVTKPFNPAELRARVRATLHTKQLIDMLAEQASIDGLTGLHNRRFFDARLAQEVEGCNRYGRSVGLLLIDVDRFKTINDTAGHPVGDHVLKAFAEHLRATCRGTDMPCRYGGDEFAVIMPQATTDNALEYGQRFIATLRADTELQGLLKHPITASIGGAATAGPHALRSDELVRRADQALYHTKEHGRDGMTIAGQPATAA